MNGSLSLYRRTHRPGSVVISEGSTIVKLSSLCVSLGREGLATASSAARKVGFGAALEEDSGGGA